MADMSSNPGFMGGDQRPTILGLSIAFPIVSIIAVILRFKARKLNRVSLEADDWTLLVALLLTIGVTIVVLLDSRLGNLGWHTQFTPEGAPLNDSVFRNNGKTSLALEVLIWPCLGLQKISVLLFYKRIFVGKNFRTIAWCFIGVSIAWTIAFEISVIAACIPITRLWDPSVKAHCVNQIDLYRAALVTDVIIDCSILLLPVYNVWKLQMRTPQKIAVIGVFLLGGFTAITGIIRLHFLTYAYASLKHPLFNDTYYNYAPAYYWSIIETNAGILSACLPTLRPIVKAYPVPPSLSRLIKSFTSSLRSTIGSSKTEFRLTSRENSMEHGLTESEREVPGVRENKAYASYDNAHAPTPSQTAIHLESTYSVSEYPHPGRSMNEK